MRPGSVDSMEDEVIEGDLSEVSDHQPHYPRHDEERQKLSRGIDYGPNVHVIQPQVELTNGDVADLRRTSDEAPRDSRDDSRDLDQSEPHQAPPVHHQAPSVHHQAPPDHHQAPPVHHQAPPDKSENYQAAPPDQDLSQQLAVNNNSTHTQDSSSRTSPVEYTTQKDRPVVVQPEMSAELLANQMERFQAIASYASQGIFPEHFGMTLAVKPEAERAAL